MPKNALKINLRIRLKVVCKIKNALKPLKIHFDASKYVKHSPKIFRYGILYYIVSSILVKKI